MSRNLIPMLADEYHVVAPNFPGYGESSAPSVNDFEYSYGRLAIVTEKFTEKLSISSYAMYLSDIGASIGFRLAVMHPERVTALIVQNGGPISKPSIWSSQRDYSTIGKIGAKRTRER